MRLARNVEDSFETHTFPCTTEEIIEEFGELELKLPNGAVTLAETLEHMPNETHTSAEDAFLTTYSALGEAAIGRKGYSDRDPTNIGEVGHERQSL